MSKAKERTKIIECESAEETFALGQRIGKTAESGTVIALLGDLGVGKTVLAQGIAAGLGIMESVNSPTFTIVQAYDGGRLPFYHFDVYRIADADEMDEIGYEDCFYGDGLTVIEWAARITELLPEDTVYIEIEKDMQRGFDFRRIVITGEGPKKV